MPTSLPSGTANKRAVDLSAVMFTLVAAMLTMLIVLFETIPPAANQGVGMGFAFAPSGAAGAAEPYD